MKMWNEDKHLCAGRHEVSERIRLKSWVPCSSGSLDQVQTISPLSLRSVPLHRNLFQGGSKDKSMVFRTFKLLFYCWKHLTAFQRTSQTKIIQLDYSFQWLEFFCFFSLQFHNDMMIYGGVLLQIAAMPWIIDVKFGKKGRTDAVRVREKQLDGRKEYHKESRMRRATAQPDPALHMNYNTRSYVRLGEKWGSFLLCCQLFEAAGGAQHADKCSTTGFIWK